jgi:hypothetical protein
MAQPSILRRSSISVCDRSGFTKLHIAQEKRERDGSKREHRERPERYKRGMYRLRLYLLADQAEGPLLSLCGRASVSRSVRPSFSAPRSESRNKILLLLPPAPRTDSDLRLAQNEYFHKT